MRRLILPTTRGECAGGSRPCPHIRCRYHLILDRSAAKGVPSLEDLTETCALDVADQGEHSLEDIGEILGLTRERVRQIEEKAQDKLKRLLLRLERGIKPLATPGRGQSAWQTPGASEGPLRGRKRMRRKKKAKRVKQTCDERKFIARVDGVEIGRYATPGAARRAVEVYLSERVEDLTDLSVADQLACGGGSAYAARQKQPGTRH